jgi:protein-L-isoaspartate O-methyltransferase
MPPALLEQLREGRRIALPLGRRHQQLCVLERTAEGARLLTAIPVRFVPLVERKNESPE